MIRRFAVVEGDTITAVVIAQAWPGAVDITDAVPRPSRGWRRVADAWVPPVQPPSATLTRARRSTVFDRLTPAEYHRWRRAAVIAEASDSPSANLRVALYGFDLFFRGNLLVDVTRQEVVTLAQALIALKVLPNAQRAQDVFAPDAADEGVSG